MSALPLLSRHSFIELGARDRARALLDPGSFTELAGPFAGLVSPWLPRQGVVPQSDDGVVVARGRIDGQPAVVLAIEGAFQGGSLGEVGGAKIAGALELAAEDNRRGTPTRAVILFETGGVRLQEANLGLAAIADIHAAIVDLRRYQPVVGVIAGQVGCFGGMSIAAGLCTALVMTREGRLGLNGPAVIEQEAGIDEYDSRDRPFIWSFTGGSQRLATGLADREVDDDCDALRDAVMSLLAEPLPRVHRSERHADYLAALSGVDATRQPTPLDVRAVLPPAPRSSTAASPERAASVPADSRGERWLAALAPGAARQGGLPPSVQVADTEIGGMPCRWIAVVPDARSRFPRARHGEVGLLEGWALAQAVREAVDADRDAPVKRVIVAVVDTPSQAYGRREEAFGIHQSLAGAVDAYAGARLAGHPVVALLVGRAMSGAFLAHGYQANRIVAIDDPGVMVHAMGKDAAARITMRSVEDLETLAADIPPMAYDVASFASLGLPWRLVPVEAADAPAADDVRVVRDAVAAAVGDIVNDPVRDLRGRLGGLHRAASAQVRACLAREWRD